MQVQGPLNTLPVSITMLRTAALCSGEVLKSRVRPKFGFGFAYGAETDVTYGFGLVSATAKVHWHKFGFGRNITPEL